MSSGRRSIYIYFHFGNLATFFKPVLGNGLSSRFASPVVETTSLQQIKIPKNESFVEKSILNSSLVE